MPSAALKCHVPRPPSPTKPSLTVDCCLLSFAFASRAEPMVERTAPPIAAVESFRKSFRSNVLFMLLSSGLTRGSSTLELGKNLQSVLVVDLLQYFVRQIDVVDSPSPLPVVARRSEEHTSELQSRGHLVCRLLLEKKKNISYN